MCCVGRKKITGKKVTIYFFQIYYTPESHRVYNYFCFVFVFDVLLCFFFICFAFVLIFIQDLDWEPNSIDLSLICIQSQLLLIIKEWFLYIYTFKLEIFNVCMFIIISLWFHIFHMLFVIWLLNARIIDVIN
jgi:hypothetical protein